jgi:hypothetical protein
MREGTTRNPMLTSERIRERFGSVGIEVLASGGRERISSLYSLADGVKTCRSYAQVAFELPIPAALAALHARVLAGASIGATFKAAGWDIERRHLYLGETRLTTRERSIADLMGIAPDTALATHRYVFRVTQHGVAHDYARITEWHHPDYLGAAELAGIYGLPLPELERPDCSVA